MLMAKSWFYFILNLHASLFLKRFTVVSTFRYAIGYCLSLSSLAVVHYLHFNPTGQLALGNLGTKIYVKVI